MFRVPSPSPLCSRVTAEPTKMRSLFLVLTALPLASFALVINHANNGAECSINTNGTTSSKYQLQHKYQGTTFFECVKAWSFLLSSALSYSHSEWDFFSGPDPTHGNVAYQTQGNSGDLAYVDGDGTAVLRVDNEGSVPPGGKRRS